MKKKHHLYFWGAVLAFALGVFFGVPEFFSSGFSSENGEKKEAEKPALPTYPPYDKLVYDAKLNELANNPLPTKVGTPTEVGAPQKPNLWPVKAPYPLAGAILPFKRVVAYYGNLYSKKMGALGEYS